jgi:hypothetical protein
MEIPPRHFGKLEIRSGLALRHELDISAGVIDNDYRGEVKIILRNHGNSDFTVKQGDRIAQMLILPQPTYEVHEVNELSTTTARGKNGFGSTGLKEIVSTPSPSPATPVATTPLQAPMLTPTDMPIAIPNDSTPRPVSPEPGDTTPIQSLPSNRNNYHIIPPDMVRTLEADLDYYPFCNVDISTDPYIDRVEIKMGTSGNHATRGLNI